MADGKIDPAGLAQEWVEIRERGDPEHIVLMRNGPNVPPGRGRRRFDLRQAGSYLGLSEGRDDRLQAVAGSWRVDGAELQVLDGDWAGTYQILSVDEEGLTLSPLGK